MWLGPRTYEDFRTNYQERLPWAVIELLLGNVVAGNYTMQGAVMLADMLILHFQRTMVTP